MSRYQLAANGEADIPIEIQPVKDWLKVSGSADDSLIRELMLAAVQYCESFTGRETRANTWELLLDNFDDPICLLKSPVASITSIEYTVSGSLVAVTASVYTLVRNNLNSFIYLADGENWPVDGDDNVHNGIKVTFVTEPVDGLAKVKIALYNHIAAMYQNRGDCSMEDAAKMSGARQTYLQYRIARV